jgi:hypothetical protein
MRLHVLQMVRLRECFVYEGLHGLEDGFKAEHSLQVLRFLWYSNVLAFENHFAERAGVVLLGQLLKQFGKFGHFLDKLPVLLLKADLLVLSE